MKIRLGFVSNSSSSSFILPINKTEAVDDIVVECKLPLSKILNDSHYDTEIYCTVKTEKELQEYIVDNYGYTGDEKMEFSEFLKGESDWLNDYYKKCVDIIKSGKYICFGSIDYNDQITTNIITEIGGEIFD